MRTGADPRLRRATRRVRQTRSATDGRFSFGDLPPGSYLLAAAEDLPDDDWRTADVLAALAPAMTRPAWLTADELAAASLTLERGSHVDAVGQEGDISISDWLRSRALARAGLTEHEDEARRLHHVEATVRPMAVEPAAGGRRWRW